ncbi:MAG: redoxin domain-containing protein [Planctomycetes bacterium]|nr:redoxin domain-containing protein [Planctomycetota bacterium]
MLILSFLLCVAPDPMPRHPLAVAASEPTMNGPRQDANTAYADLVKECEAAVKAWRDELRALSKSDKAKAELLEKRHPVIAFWPRFEALSASDGRALLWMLEEGDKLPGTKSQAMETKARLVAELLHKHANQPWAGSDVPRALARQRMWFDEAWVRAQLEALASASQTKEVSASALAALAGRLTGRNATPEELARAKAIDARITSEFAGTSAAKAVAEKQAGAAYEKGGVPDDFEATDTDGVKFKLSDYRGKVVLLDFWGFW